MHSIYRTLLLLARLGANSVEVQILSPKSNISLLALTNVDMCPSPEPLDIKHRLHSMDRWLQMRTNLEFT